VKKFNFCILIIFLTTGMRIFSNNYISNFNEEYAEDSSELIYVQNIFNFEFNSFFYEINDIKIDNVYSLVSFYENVNFIFKEYDFFHYAENQKEVFEDFKDSTDTKIFLSQKAFGQLYENFGFSSEMKSLFFSRNGDFDKNISFDYMDFFIFQYFLDSLVLVFENDLFDLFESDIINMLNNEAYLIYKKYYESYFSKDNYDFDVMKKMLLELSELNKENNFIYLKDIISDNYMVLNLKNGFVDNIIKTLDKIINFYFFEKSYKHQKEYISFFELVFLIYDLDYLFFNEENYEMSFSDIFDYKVEDFFSYRSNYNLKINNRDINSFIEFVISLNHSLNSSIIEIEENFYHKYNFKDLGINFSIPLKTEINYSINSYKIQRTIDLKNSNIGIHPDIIDNLFYLSLFLSIESVDGIYLALRNIIDNIAFVKIDGTDLIMDIEIDNSIKIEYKIKNIFSSLYINLLILIILNVFKFYM